MTEPSSPQNSIQSNEGLKSFNEFQAQFRARIETTVKLVLLVSGGMLTLSVGAVLGNSSLRIPTSLFVTLKWGWGLLFYSIAASILILGSMIVATFHMGVRWRAALETRNSSSTFIATWNWLRIINAVLGASILVSFLVGVYLVARVAIDAADSVSASLTDTHAIIAPALAVEQHGVSTNTRDQPNDSQRPTSTATIPSQVTTKLNAPDRIANEIDQKAKERKEKAALDKKLVDFNGDLAFYTEVLAIVAIFQFLALLGQVVFLRLAFKESKRAGDIARDAMIAGERAFVFAMSAAGLYEQDTTTKGYNWRLRPVWKNSGDTPTRNMLMHTECVIQNSQLTHGFNFGYATTQTGTALIPPNTDVFDGTAPRAPAPAITPQDIVDAQHGKKFIYMWGWAKYKDVFPGTPEHVTRFCWLVNPIGDPFAFTPSNPNGLTFGTILHFEGNCADDECVNY